jgi:sensor histidine kinase YesM
MTRVRDILLHIICCAAFLSIPVFLASEEANIGIFSRGVLRDLLAYSLTIGYFYLNYYYLLPRFYLRRSYFLFALFTLLCFAVITFGSKYAIPLSGSMLHHKRPPWQEILADINHNLFRFLFVYLVSLMMRIRDQWKRAREGKTAAELAFLKAQIQPHFLYNTLNTIYALVIEGSPHTAGAITRLSGMMRYVTDEASLDYVPLSNELTYLESYITLQELRFGTTVGISSIVNGDPDGYRIPPMLLIPFIENAFKHGINPEEASGIVVRINISNDILRMNVRNRLVHARPERDSSGKGLANTKARLALLYPGRYELNTSIDEGVYAVSLSLTLV